MSARAIKYRSVRTVTVLAYSLVLYWHPRPASCNEPPLYSRPTPRPLSSLVPFFLHHARFNFICFNAAIWCYSVVWSVLNYFFSLSTNLTVNPFFSIVKMVLVHERVPHREQPSNSCYLDVTSLTASLTLRVLNNKVHWHYSSLSWFLTSYAVEPGYNDIGL